MGNNLARALENSTSVNAFALFLAVCCSLTRSAAVPIGRRRARITFQTDHNPIRMHQKSIRCVVLVRLLLLLHRRRREFLFLFLFCTSRTADLLAFRILFFILHNLFSTISQKAVGLPFNENKKEKQDQEEPLRLQTTRLLCCDYCSRDYTKTTIDDLTTSRRQMRERARI